MTIIPRDQSLDSELESGAHLTLILIAIGLAFLLTATAIIFYLFPVCRLLRRTLFSRHPPVGDPDSGQARYSTDGKEVFRPKMTSTPIRPLVLPQRPKPPCHQATRAVQTQRSPTFFVARHPVPLPYPQPNASYPSLFNHRTQSLHRTHTTHRSRPLPLPPPLPTAHMKMASPDIVGWMMRIADDVVGRHPFAIPLFDRVATQAEVTLISGHVHVPWAREERQAPPPPLKSLGPARDCSPKRFGHLASCAATEANTGAFDLRDEFEGISAIDRHASPSLITLKIPGLEYDPVSANDHLRKENTYMALQQE